MNFKSFVVITLVLAFAIPLSAGPDKKKVKPRGMLEKMEAVPCGAKQRGLTGLGSIWASAGVTHVNSDEKLCPQYLLRTDDMDYQIRPTDSEAPAVVPTGKEAEFKVKKDRMFLRMVDDKKAEQY